MLYGPTDGSATSERIFPIAQRLARQLGAPVTLLRVIDPMSFYSGAAMLPTSVVWADAAELPFSLGRAQLMASLTPISW